jgi:hypothetical protein
MLLSVLHPRSDSGVGACFLARELHAGILPDAAETCWAAYIRFPFQNRAGKGLGYEVNRGSCMIHLLG